MSDDLMAWLHGQLDAEERSVEDDVLPSGEAAWVLANVDAQRRILDLAVSSVDPHDDEQVWYQQAIVDVARLLALPRAARPGYRHEWRPE